MNVLVVHAAPGDNPVHGNVQQYVELQGVAPVLPVTHVLEALNVCRIPFRV
jgi:hypothetical protein